MGDSSCTLDDKVTQVLQQLEAHTAKVVYDLTTESWNIVAASCYSFPATPEASKIRTTGFSKNISLELFRKHASSTHNVCGNYTASRATINISMLTRSFTRCIRAARTVCPNRSYVPERRSRLNAAWALRIPSSCVAMIAGKRIDRAVSLMVSEPAISTFGVPGVASAIAAALCNSKVAVDICSTSKKSRFPGAGAAYSATLRPEDPGWLSYPCLARICPTTGVPFARTMTSPPEMAIRPWWRLLIRGRSIRQHSFLRSDTIDAVTNHGWWRDRSVDRPQIRPPARLADLLPESPLRYPGRPSFLLAVRAARVVPLSS